VPDERLKRLEDQVQALREALQLLARATVDGDKSVVQRLEEALHRVEAATRHGH
jgi:hypothetical protein